MPLSSVNPIAKGSEIFIFGGISATERMDKIFVYNMKTDIWRASEHKLKYKATAIGVSFDKLSE